MQAPPIAQQQMQELFHWLQSISFSRSPKNLARDFSDGVLMAQVMSHHFPHSVQLHNYQPANSSASKYINWKTLNEKVFRKLGFQVVRSDLQAIIIGKAGTIQRVLFMIYGKIVAIQQNSISQNDSLAKKLSQMSNNVQNTTITNNNKSLNYTNASGLKTVQQMTQLSRTQFAKQMTMQLAQKQKIIKELRETVQILQVKMKKMDQLSKLKDAKIDSLMRKLDQGIGL